jgi:hypothetical protein
VVHAPSFRHQDKFQRAILVDQKIQGHQALIGLGKPSYPFEIEQQMSEARKHQRLDMRA